MLNEIAEKIICRINELLKENKRVIVAIDGRCASGKSTLSVLLKKSLNCNVIAADDFFLRPEQRTRERFSEVGGNIDYERLSVTLMELKQKGNISYQPYNCSTKTLDPPIKINNNKITIIEGSYSCHPKLWDYYDLHIFLTLPADLQLERLKKRNPKLVERFINEWIPLEEKYFSETKVSEKCEMFFEIK